MRVVMLEEEKGSPNGIRVEKYEKGAIYDLTDRLAGIFIDLGSAKEVGRQRKNIGDAPSNKAVTPEVIPKPETQQKGQIDENLPKEKKKKAKKDKPTRRVY